MFKKTIFLVFVAGLFLFSVSMAYAAQSDTVAIKVKITPSLSVNITETELSLGEIAVGAVKVSGSAITVKNEGSGLKETYSLSLSNPTGWMAKAEPGANEYVLNAAFSDNVAGITWDEAKHALSATATACSDTKFVGDKTGAVVPYGETRKLWFQFKAPTSTNVTAEQSIVVTITAQAS